MLGPRKMKTLIKYIESLIKSKFFGKLEIMFESGKIHRIRKEQTFSMDTLREKVKGD